MSHLGQTQNYRVLVHAGQQTSTGVTSWAMTTSLAFLASISAVTWFRPNLTTVGLGPSSALDSSPLVAACRVSAGWRRCAQSRLLLGQRGEAGLLGGLVLRADLVEDAEELRGGVLVQRVRELVDGRRDLEAVLQHAVLALEAHVLGPANKAGQVALGLDVIANAVVLSGHA